MRRISLIVIFLAGLAVPGSAQTGENVAVVINTASAASQQVGEHYVRRRAVPASNVIRIRTSEDESITRETFISTIVEPIAAALERDRLHDRVLYIVLTKGIPLRVAGTGGQEGTVASVDSELALLYRQMTGQIVPLRGRVDNPYFLGTRDVKEARPFTHREFDVFLVSRLDAFTVEQAIALIDKAQAPATTGRIVLDQRSRVSDVIRPAGDTWLKAAADRLAALGHGDRVLLESTTQGVRDVAPVIGYYSWGSNDPSNRIRTVGMGFVPGAIAATFVSSDARTLRQPPPSWVPTSDDDKTKWFGGSPQSLIGDLIREGATGVAGHVAEPYLASTVRPEILFPAYVSGFNLVEAFYLAVPHLSWQTVVIGDPLCAPFARPRLTPEEIDPGFDAQTELPAFFSKRRLAEALRGAPKAFERAMALVIRAEGLIARGQRAGARAALEEATQLAPDFAVAQIQLASVLEAAGETELAIDRYKRVIALQPDNAAALNNLAFAMATRRNAPKEALPLARRAAAAAPREGNVLDTLAWIEHLVGDDATARQHISQAIQFAPGVAEIRLHAAAINAAAGALAEAEAQLKEALRLDPALEKRDEVREVRAALQKTPRQR